MSTKNLARTVIEGGRTRWSRWERRHSNGEHRAMAREALAHATLDPAMDDLVVPARPKVHRTFADKLGPPRRWLERQVGRPWNKVRGELLELFDTRTTPGRHIVFCHMFPWVEGQSGRLGRAPFTVDKHGILRRAAERRFRFWRPREPLPYGELWLVSWLAGRRVGDRARTLFWFMPTAAGAYRQHLRLDEQESTLWRSLPDWFRECHAPSAPPPLPNPDSRTRI